MSNSQSKYVDSAATIDNGGFSDDWTNLSNVEGAGDSSVTSSTVFASETDYLRCYFDFNIPSGATILGVVVDFDVGFNGPVWPKDYGGFLVKGGTIDSSGYEGSTVATLTASFSMGESAAVGDWDGLPTVAEVNASDFGFAFYIGNVYGGETYEIDSIEMTVYYSGGGEAVANALFFGGGL